MTATAAALFLYLAVVTCIGIWSARRSSQSPGEFYLGGRTMNELVVALSAVVSGRSAWLMMGMVGLVFVYGVRMAWFIPGYVVMELLLFLFAAPRIRRFTQRHDDVTFIDYLASRFGDKSGVLRVVAAVIVVIFFTAYVGAQLKAGQVMFNMLFDWDSVVAGIALMGAIVGLYTILGGFRAVSITDVIQATLMIGGLVALPIVGFLKAGGFTEGWGKLQAIAAEDGASFSLLAFGGLAGIVSGLGIGFGSPGNPHIIVRYMSIDRPERLRNAALIGTVWNVLLGWGAVWTGLAARALYAPSLLPDPKNQAFVHMATDLFPPFLAGIMLAALVAAIMSTADSQLLVISSSITRDVYAKVVRRGNPPDPRRAVTLGRVTTAVVIVLAALLSWVSTEAGKEGVFSTVFSYVLLAWSGLGASFGPPLLLSLWWRRATRAGALTSFVVGAATCILWVAAGWKKETGLHEAGVGFVVSTLAFVVVSLLTKPPRDVDRLLEAMRPNR